MSAVGNKTFFRTIGNFFSGQGNRTVGDRVANTLSNVVLGKFQELKQLKARADELGKALAYEGMLESIGGRPSESRESLSKESEKVEAAFGLRLAQVNAELAPNGMKVTETFYGKLRLVATKGPSKPIVAKVIANYKKAKEANQ